jgi:hypothetical protein
LGLEAQLNGERCVIVGRTRWESKYREFWVEEGETGYSTETWEYDEWVLLSENRSLIYLIEDAEGFAFAKTLIPKSPDIPQHETDRLNFMGGVGRTIQEFGNSRVIFHEGESSYQVRLNQLSRFASYTEKNIEHIAEWRVNAQNEILEIEFFIEESVPTRYIASIFGVDEAAARAAGANLDQGGSGSGLVDEATAKKLIEKARFWKFVGQMGMLTALAMLAMFVRSYMLDEVLVQQSFPLQSVASAAAPHVDRVMPTLAPTPPVQLARLQEGKPGAETYTPTKPGTEGTPPPDNSPPSQEDAPTADNAPSANNPSTDAPENETPMRAVGSLQFEVTDLDATYELLIQAQGLVNNTEILIGAEIVDHDSVPIRAIEGDFYYAAGSDYECDEDGCGYYDWTEESSLTTFMFVADSVGTYTVRLYSSPTPRQQSASLQVTLQKVAVGFWYGLFGLILLLVFLIVYARANGRIRRLSYYQNIQNNTSVF